MVKKKVVKKEQNIKTTYKRNKVVNLNLKKNVLKTENQNDISLTQNNKKQKTKKNKIQNNDIKDSDMEQDKLSNINNILNDEKLPEKKVKIEKKDKGLFERTENSTILITEDNKIMLTD